MEDETIQRLSSITCIFNERSVFIKKKRIKIIIEKLEQELKEDEDSVEEKIHKLNFLTWLEFKLGHFAKAKIRNDKAMSLTNNDNVSVWLGKAWIARATGDVRDFNDCFLHIESLTSNFTDELAKSRAQMAYCFCRLQTTEFLNRGIQIYTELIKEYPQNYNWRLGLGLAHRLAINRFFHEKQEHALKSAGQFCSVVSESDDRSLRRQALCQIASLKALSIYHKLYLEEYYIVFRKTLEELCHDALEYGADDPKTLTILGDTLMKVQLFDEAINKLEKSLQIKQTQLTYFYLGKGYERKVIHSNAVLSKRNKEILKAIESYRKCIDLSYNTNYSAFFTLGRLLVKLGEIDEAMPMFSIIIDNSRLVVKHGYKFELYSSYQLKAFCLLIKGKENRSSKFDEINKSLIENCLLQSVNLACASKIFESNDVAIEFLLRPLNEKGLEIPRILRQLREYQMPVQIFSQKLKKFKESKNYESAFTFLTFYGDIVCSENIKELQSLMLEVKLYTAASRLQHDERSVHFITRPLFESIYKKSHQSEKSPFDNDIHVLILCDNQSPTSLQKSSLLKKILSKIYGLDVCVHQESIVQLIDEEIDATKIVFVLLDKAQKSRYFQDILAHIGDRFIDGDAPETGAKIVIGLSDDVQLDPLISRLPSIQLGHFHWADISGKYGVAIGGQEDQFQEGSEFTDHVNELMSLYCFLIGHSWPLNI